MGLPGPQKRLVDLSRNFKSDGQGPKPVPAWSSAGASKAAHGPIYGPDVPISKVAGHGAPSVLLDRPPYPR